MGIAGTIVLLIGVWIVLQAIRWGRCLFFVVWMLFGALIVVFAWVFLTGQWRV